ncbi:MAG: hypothetical protein ABI462_09935 [Ignavibacteria bacterium]
MHRIKFLSFYLGLILLLSFAVLSCSNDDNVITPLPVDSSDFRYPFKDGSTWNYTITTSASDIHPDSILHYFSNYPLVTNGTATILYDTMINSVVTKCFLDEFNNGTISYSNRYYYINNDTSLILYASRQQGPPTGMLPLRKIKLFPDVQNDNLPVVYDNKLEVQEDSLYSTLKYPMRTGTEWSYYFPSLNYSYTRKYLGFETIIISSGTFSCMKELTTISLLPNTSYFNYYSGTGLMKTRWFTDDNVHTTVFSPDGDGTYDITTEMKVTSYNIPEN